MAPRLNQSLRRKTNRGLNTFRFHRLAYDNLNRLVGLVDQAGTTGFTWTDGNQVASEDGPWSEDTVSYAYLGRQRQSHSVVQPNASPWVQGYVYDDLARLRSVSSPAGSVAFEYTAYDLENRRTFNGGPSVQTASDTLARTTSKYLWATGVEGPSYSYDMASQRTQAVYSAGNYVNYTYDNIGQLKTAFGYEAGGGTRLNERFGYAYDGAWNLNRRTNNALVQTFNVNNLNQLTTATRDGTLTVAGTVGSPNVTPSVTVSGTGLASGAATLYGDGTWARAGATPADGPNSYTATATAGGRTSVDSVSYTLPATVTFTYDGDGNLTSDGSRTFEYDFENQLTNLYVATKWRSEFVYDTLMRCRVRKEYTWLGGAWVQTNEVRYVYDQRLVVQERWYNPQISLSTPQKLITYTRGNDLSRDLQEAGGIGGLLARSDSSLMQSDPGAAHVFYATDANGNVTALVNTQNTIGARYQYDPYGNIISMSGPMAEANLYRFSSKELHPNSGLVYYLYRYYEPNLQRWVNRDPLGEAGGINLYGFVLNSPLYWTDPYGLHWTDYIPDILTDPGTVNFFAGLGDGVSFGVTGLIRDANRDFYGQVDRCSGAYATGLVGGTALGFAWPAGGVAKLAGGADRVLIGTAESGIYRFAGRSGRNYIGQSGQVGTRLGRHAKTGRLPAGSDPVSWEVRGGKLARERAEQQMIRREGLQNLENVLNPLGGRPGLYHYVPTVGVAAGAGSLAGAGVGALRGGCE
jgi:RHS repeat-associated protein